MKKLAILFTTFVLFLFVGALPISSQKQFQVNNNIVILAAIPAYSFKSAEVTTVKIVTVAGKSLDDYAKIGESPPWKGVKVDHCDNCPLANFGFGIISNKIIDKNIVKVEIEIEFGNERACNAKKKFFLIRGKKIEIKLKCGVKYTAFYGFDLENIENNEQSSNNN